MKRTVCIVVVFAACHPKTTDHDLRAKASPGLERTAADALWDLYSIDVAHPPVVQNLNPDGTPAYATTVVYQGNYAYRVYLNADGTHTGSVNVAQRPAGTVRTVCLLIDYDGTDFSTVYTTDWVTMQNSVNASHQAYAKSQGFAQPIVQFQFQNLLVGASGIADPTNAAQVTAYLNAQNIPSSSYDVVTVLNLNPRVAGSGYTTYGGNLITLGWFFTVVPEGQANMTDDVLHSVAAATYGLEMGHVWGWENEWDTNTSDTPDLLLPWASPALFGWTDTNGNGIPEILDPHPY